MRVIIADDHQVVRFGLKALLESEGSYQVVAEAENLNDLKVLVQEQEPNIVILDYKMPGGHAVAVANYLKRRHSELKILIFTAQESAVILKELYLSLVDGVLLKQDQSSEVLVALRVICAGQRYVSQKVIEYVGNIDLELTSREMQILQLILQGLPRSRIASQLDVSAETVKTHRRNLMRKLEVQNVTQLVNKDNELKIC